MIAGLTARPLTSALLVGSLLGTTVLGVGCGDGGTARSTTTTGDAATSTSAPPSMGTMRVILVAGVDRSEPPGGTGTDASPQATVPASVDQAWTSGGWGPAGSDDPAPPLPEGFTPVLAWVRFPTTGWTVDVVDAGLVDGTLVLSAERTAPGVGCVNAQVLTGVSYLLGVRVDGDVTPATPVEVRFIDRTVDC